MALVPWSPLKTGFLSGKYRRGAQVTDSARTAHVGGPNEDEVSAPTLNYPAPMHGAQRAMLQFAGTIVDGERSTVYPPLLQSTVRY